MLARHRTILGVALALLLAASLRLAAARSSEDDRRKEIDAFNKNYIELHLKMQTQAILDLWAEDGVDLMPGNDPLIGRKKISAWVEDAIARMPGYKVVKQEMDFHDIRVCREWASEWATTRQVVHPPDDKPAIESYGKIALILHREGGGQWKVQQEMWNAAPKP